MLDDGLLDIVVDVHVGKLRSLANLPKVFKGAHVQLPSVHVFQAEEVRISADRPFTLYADGDPIGELPVRVRGLPGAVTMITPRAGGPALRPAVAPSRPLEQPPSTAQLKRLMPRAAERQDRARPRRRQADQSQLLGRNQPAGPGADAPRAACDRGAAERASAPAAS